MALILPHNATSLSRDSNFELLRIVAIILVIMHHCVVYGAKGCGYFETTESSLGLVSVNALCVIGVNLFVLITGWYGIKTPIKSAIRILIDVITIKFTCYLVAIFFGWRQLSLTGVLYNLHFGGYWYVNVYIALLMLSPILERGLKQHPSESTEQWIIKMKIVTALIITINCIFAWSLQIWHINSTGYTLVQMISLYVMARFMRVYMSERKSRKNPLKAIGGGNTLYINILLLATITCLNICGYYILVEQLHLRGGGADYFSYNNPLVILESVVVFLIFSHIQLKNKIINTVAKTTFGIYIAHISLALGDSVYKYMNTWYVSHGVLGLTVCAIILFVLCAVGCHVALTMRNKLFDIIGFSKMLSKWCAAVDNKIV